MEWKLWRKSTARIATNLTFVLGSLMSELRIDAALYEVELSSILSHSALPQRTKLFLAETIEAEFVPAIQTIVVIINTAKVSQYEPEFLALAIRCHKLAAVDDAYLKLKVQLENLPACRPLKPEDDVSKVQVDIMGKVDWMMLRSTKKKVNLKFISEAVDGEWQVLNVQKDISEVQADIIEKVDYDA